MSSIIVITIMLIWLSVWFFLKVSKWPLWMVWICLTFNKMPVYQQHPGILKLQVCFSCHCRSCYIWCCCSSSSGYCYFNFRFQILDPHVFQQFQWSRFDLSIKLPRSRRSFVWIRFDCLLSRVNVWRGLADRFLTVSAWFTGNDCQHLQLYL